MAGLLLDLLRLALVGLCVYGIVDAARRPAAAFPAHGKLTKQIWLAILVISGLAIYTLGVVSFLGLPGIVAVTVYVVDVKPAVSGTSNPWG